MVRVVARALGIAGHSVYYSKAGSFRLFPASDGRWIVEAQPVGPRGGKRPPSGHCFPSKALAFDHIENFITR